MANKKIYKRWWFWVIAIIIVFGVIGGGKEEPKSAKSETSKPVSAESKQDSEKKTETKKDDVKKEENKKEFFGVNEPVELDGMIMTVTSVEKSAGADFDVPAEGKEYVIVNVKIQNKGKEKLAYNPFYFKMQNSKGQIEDMGFITVNTDTALHDGELAEGGEVEGTIAFEQPKDDPQLMLLYENNIFSKDEKIKFKLN